MMSLTTGSEYPVQSLEEWIDEVMVDTTRGGPCTRIALVHCKNGEEGREVWTAPINGKRPSELATIFLRKARSTAQELGMFGSGVQMFELWAFYGEDTVHKAWHPLPIKSKAPRDGFGSEGPAGHGPEAQRMRQHENVFQQTYAKQAHLDATQATLISFLGNTVVSVLQENARLARESIEMARREQDRSHEYRMTEINAIKAMELQQKLLTLLPAGINTAFGKEVFPQQTADTALITAIVENTEPSQLEMLPLLFKDKPEIAGMLSARIGEILKAKSDKEDARAKALGSIPKGPEPIDDAAGGPVIRLVEGKKK
jgi:hypothetical protein